MRSHSTLRNTRILLFGLCLISTTGFACFGQEPEAPAEQAAPDVYLPIDHWAYLALDRLYALGYLDEAHLGIRPWTRRSIAKLLDDSGSVSLENDPQVVEIMLALKREFGTSRGSSVPYKHPDAHLESVYVRVRGISGTPLRDSWHLGQTFTNDYARPYQSGVSTVQGQSGYIQSGRFSLYVRGEFQSAPSAAGYSHELASILADQDEIPLSTNPRQATIPEGPLAASRQFRLLEGNVGFRLPGHQITLGKTDHWMSAGRGGSFAYTNNAENIYGFHIDRTDPLWVPGLSRLTGPFRYSFFVGSLKGHTMPNSPWMHLEKLSFKPYRDLEIGFSRTIIWGGKGHQPVNLHTFLNGFFHLSNVTDAQKLSADDPGARFSMFDLNWRIPLLRRWLSFYLDGLVHDDVSPISAPRHAGLRTGLYLAMVPFAPRLDFRIEGFNTDPQVRRSFKGYYLYNEFIQRQGYTNQGFIMGDAAGRESKGGQAWMAYHLSPQEKIEVSYRFSKAAKDFVPLGTTQHIASVEFVKRIHSTFEVNLQLQGERWAAPIYKTDPQKNFSATGGIRWYPDLHHTKAP